MNLLHELVTTLALEPRDALTWAGHADEIEVELALRPRPPAYELSIAMSPRTPHQSLFAVPRALWFGAADKLTPTLDPGFDARVALRCEPRLVALFDHEHRHLLVTLMEHHQVVIDAGRVLLFVEAAQRTLHEAFADALAMARHLAAADLALGVRRFLADPDPRVRDHLERLAKDDSTLYRLIAAARADSARERPDLTHSALLAQVRDNALDLPRRSAAFARLLTDFPWTETARALPRLGAFLGMLSAAERGAPFVQLMEELGPRWQAPDLDAGAAFAIAQALWSVRPPWTPRLGQAFALIIRRLAHPEMVPWIRELLGTRDDALFDEALELLTRLGATRSDVRNLIPPSLRGLLIERAHLLAKRGRVGAAVLEIAASSLPPESSAQLEHHLTLLGELGDPESVALLVAQFEHYDAAVRAAAIVATGRCGTLEHLPYLEPLTSGLFRSGEVKQLARAAIAAIRDRAGLRDVPGALSLSGGTPGGLTLPEE